MFSDISIYHSTHNVLYRKFDENADALALSQSPEFKPER